MKIFLEYIAWICIGLVMCLIMYMGTRLFIPSIQFNDILPFMLAVLLGISAGYIISHRITK